MEIHLKKCSCCCETKEIQHFSLVYERHDNYCKPCRSQYRKDYQRKNYERISQKEKEYYQIHKERLKAYRRAYYHANKFADNENS